MHHNLIIKDGDTTKVVKEVLVDGIQFVDETPREGSTNFVTSGGVEKAIADTKESVDEDVQDLQQQIDDIAEKAGSGYIPKGEADVATLNALSGQENGWLYTMTDTGTLTLGSLAVVAGDTVAWDATNSVWYKAMDYAPRQYGTNEVHNLATAITDFRTGDVIPVDGTSGTAKMSKESLLAITAQNSINKSVTNNSAVNVALLQLVLPEGIAANTVTAIKLFRGSKSGDAYLAGIQLGQSGVYTNFLGYYATQQDAVDSLKNAFVFESSGKVISAIVDWSKISEGGKIEQAGVTVNPYCDSGDFMPDAKSALEDYLLNKKKADKLVVSNNASFNSYVSEILIPSSITLSQITSITLFKGNKPGAYYWCGVRLSLSGVYKDFVFFTQSATQKDELLKTNFVYRNSLGEVLSAIIDWDSLPSTSNTFSLSLTSSCQNAYDMPTAYSNITRYQGRYGYEFKLNASPIIDAIPWVQGNYNNDGSMSDFPSRISTGFIEIPQSVVKIDVCCKSLAHNYAVVLKVFDADKQRLSDADGGTTPFLNRDAPSASLTPAKSAKYITFTARRNASDNINLDEFRLLQIDIAFTIVAENGEFDVIQKCLNNASLRTSSAIGQGSYYGEQISLGEKKSYNIVKSKSFYSLTSGFDEDMRYVQSSLAFGDYIFIFSSSSTNKVFVLYKRDLSVAKTLTLPTEIASHCNNASWLPWAYTSGDYFPMLIVSDATDASYKGEVFRLSGNMLSNLSFSKVGKVSTNCRDGLTSYAPSYICDRNTNKMVIRTACDKAETIFDPHVSLSRIASSHYSKFHIYRMPSFSDFVDGMVTDNGFEFNSGLEGTFFARFATGQDADCSFGKIFQQMDFTSEDDRLCGQEGIWVYDEVSGCELSTIAKLVPVDDPNNYGESEGVSIDGCSMYWIQHNYDYTDEKPILKVQEITF